MPLLRLPGSPVRPLAPRTLRRPRTRILEVERLEVVDLGAPADRAALLVEEALVCREAVGPTL